MPCLPCRCRRLLPTPPSTSNPSQPPRQAHPPAYTLSTPTPEPRHRPGRSNSPKEQKPLGLELSARLVPTGLNLSSPSGKLFRRGTMDGGIRGCVPEPDVRQYLHTLPRCMILFRHATIRYDGCGAERGARGRLTASQEPPPWEGRGRGDGTSPRVWLVLGR